ncbi:MAG: ABC transporter permease [Cypionkella sp.]|uniref:ABC transporter permease n=1 Tax=Cypionkella sp. TaxID=2811411 RepID=UPI002ABC3BAA|nr:ABC transporter permease [Cypionkella sp.]MDZ4313136.1 ABC transporter permease [Cypionkella sp.]
MTAPTTLPANKILIDSATPRRRRFASFRTITALVLREMATSYGRSPGGYLWAVLEPVAGIALLSAVFALLFRAPALGINFPLFYATGMIPFVTFSSVSAKLAQAINFSKPLLAYPSVTFLDAILARFILNMLTEIMVAYLVFTGILLIFETRVLIDLPIIAEALLLAGALALGVGTLNCFLFTRFPIWQQAWSILMRPMFIISCVFMIYNNLPEFLRGWLWYNPLVHIVGLMRRGFYSSYDAPYVSQGYVLGFSAVCLVMGLIFLRRYQYELLHN